MFLRVGQVAGFYSTWSPEVSTSNVKVLTGGSEQEINVPPAVKLNHGRGD